MANTAEEKAIRHLSQIRYHRNFILKANPDHGRPEPMRVTYADLDYHGHSSQDIAPGSQASEFVDGPNVFLIGGMFGTRYMCAGNIDALARKHRCRLISADKFDFGGTGHVSLEYRVKSFIDLISALLDHLNVKYVTFVSHSAGTIYNLNAALQLRNRLHPRNPFLCLISPWVHPSRSGEMKTLNFVPDALLGRTDKVMNFVINNITPSFQFSGGLYSKIRNLGISKPVATEQHMEDEEYDDFMDYHSASELGDTFDNTRMSYLFTENTKGGNEEAFLCLRRGAQVSWGYFEDYDEAVSNIFAAEAERNPISTRDCFATTESEPEPPSNDADQNGRLRVKIFFADDDSFIGKKGRDWMEGIWQQAQNLGGSVIYESSVIEGSDHDSIVNVNFGVIDSLFEEIRRLWGS